MRVLFFKPRAFLVGLRNRDHPLRTLALRAIILTMLILTTVGQDLVVNVNLRMLDVFVEDENGRPVLDLTTDDFEVLENGKPRPAATLSLERQRIALGFLVDRSSSIRVEKRKIDNAVIAAIQKMNPDDQAFLMAFASHHELTVSLTTGRSDLLRGLLKSKLEYGSRVYDAIAGSLRYLASTGVERKALIVFSDGADHYSRYTFEQLLEIAALHGLPIYTVGYVGDDSRTSSERGRQEIRRQMEDLAETTGGKVFFPRTETDCSNAATQIIQRLRYEYRLGYYASDGFPELSSVQIRVRGGSKHVIIRTQEPLM